jgi:hydroxypyruvate isomerase
VALVLAGRIGCQRLNALVGVRRPELELEAQLELARANVAWAAERARAQGASIMIGAVNSYENGPYLLDTTGKAIAFLDANGADHVALQYDVYHMQRTEGNLSDPISRLLPRIGHVQIADPPSRSEPGAGEINYGFVLGLLERGGYEGWLGLEYNPSTATTEESLSWMREFGYA